MDNPLVKKNLIDAIVELREEIERRLKANKYYVAMQKLDELLDAIGPLDLVEGTSNPPETQTAEAEPAAAPEDEERTWSGRVEETVGDPSWRQAGEEAPQEEARA